MTDGVDATRVAAAAHALNIHPDPETISGLTVFGNLFLSWNARINLGGRIGPTELVERHLTDAFAASPFIEKSVSVVDVGTGGGLPAIALALLCREARFELFEPVGKKVTFLRTAIRELGLNQRVAVWAARLDGDSADRLARKFDVATSRATFSPAEWLRLGQRLVHRGGRVLVFATGVHPTGCPHPQESVQYAADRKLLVYGVPAADSLIDP